MLITVKNVSANILSTDVGSILPGQTVARTMDPKGCYGAAANLKGFVDAGLCTVTVAEESSRLDSIEPGILGVVSDLSVSTGKIIDLAVTTDKIADLAVTNTKIGDDAVDTGQIANLAVVEGKIANGAVTSTKLAAGVATSVSDLASVANAKGASLVGIEDPTNLITATNVEAALVELAGNNFTIEATLTNAESATGKLLFATAKLPSGKKIYVDSFAVLVNGGTAWTDVTATIVKLQDLNGTPVVFATIAKAGLTGNAVLFPNTANVTLGAGFWSGGTADKGLTVIADAAFAAGSTLAVRVTGHLG